MTQRQFPHEWPPDNVVTEQSVPLLVSQEPIVR